MQLALVKGTVTATQKVADLEGVSLKVLSSCDDQGTEFSEGKEFIAIDDIGARPGDLVMWVGKREASMAVQNPTIVNRIPVDAAITGIVDDIS